MSGVYGGSAINIAATSAKDGTMGCFFKSAQAFRMPRTLRGESRFWDFALDNHFDTLLCEPLLRRAWVFQERFLAPRTLHFTNSQIFWECREGRRCGLFPTRVLQDLVYWSGFPKSIPRRGDSASWQNIVEIYSAGMLTNATDRLVAISGVARWLQAHYEDDYLAGIWRKDMERQLCWYVRKRDYDHLITSIPRSKFYLAPSWSWASILNGVQFMQTESSYWCTQKLLIRVLDAHTILENEEYKFGKATGGALRLAVRYLLYGVECPPSPEEESGDIANSTGDTILDYYRVVWDCPGDPSPKKKLYLLPVNSTCDDRANQPYGNHRPGIDGWEPNLEKNKKPAICNIDGIILEATEASKRAEYRRVGSWTSGNVKDLEEKSDDSDESLYEEVEENGTKLRVITII
ncbi:Heterokaryon incompatibility protein [Rutstroemia sp. NJR-2017a BBW]|nr:Heterokaryon incompatibility protein [Rutstroemia sp. NJR-2017a BBW]